MNRPGDDGAARIASLEEELTEVREALRATQAELLDLRSSLAFRGAHALSRRFHLMVPPGTRRARGVARARAFLRFFFRWRLGFASRAAREELRGLLHGLRPAATDAPEMRHVLPATSKPVFDIDEWDGAPVLREAEVERLLKQLWAGTRAERRARPS